MDPIVVELDDGDAPLFASAKETDTSIYVQWCIHHLSSMFPRVRIVDLRSALKHHRGNLLSAYIAISDANNDALLKEQKMETTHDVKLRRKEKWLPYSGLKLMKTQRSFPAEKPDVTCPFFERDWGELQANLVTTSIVKQVEVHTFECGCCCSDVPFEEMVQCADGHLFCCVCLRKSIEESTYGTLPASAALLCLDMAGCDQTIPLSELRRVVEFNLLSKYEERQANDCIAKARLEGLVRCPFCNFACDLDVGIDVLDCPSCWKKSCVKCKEPSHEPLRCEQVEKPSDTEHRRQIEEIMTGSILRHCTACKAVLIKDGGCNKIKCRCGQSMCYVCRSAITDYKHFCNHFREPGKGCSTCKGCFLWDQEDSDAVVLHAKRAALKRKAMDDPNILTREIGPAETLFVSKRKR